MRDKQVGEKPTFVGEGFSEPALSDTHSPPSPGAPGLCSFRLLKSNCSLRNLGSPTRATVARNTISVASSSGQRVLFQRFLGGRTRRHDRLDRLLGMKERMASKTSHLKQSLGGRWGGGRILLCRKQSL